MAYKIHWIEEPRCALVTLTDRVSQDEVETLMTTVVEVLEQNTTAFHMIVDTSSRPTMEFNVFKIPVALKVAGHERFGWLAAVAPTSLVSFWMEGLHRMCGMRFKVYPSIEEAQLFLNGMMKLEREQESNGGEQARTDTPST